MKNILFLSVMNGSPWGGSEEPWYQAALCTARHGYTTAVCCFDGDGKEKRMEELSNAGCKLFLLPGKEEIKKQPLLGKIKLNKIVSEVPFEEYDLVIVSQGGWKDVAYRPFKKLCRRMRSYVLIYHSYNVNEKISFRKFMALQKWAENASKNIGDTLRIFKALEDTYSFHIPHQEKSYNPLTIAVPAEVIPYPPLIDGKYIFSVFAALDIKRKAQDILVRALAASEWRDRNWELHLYGEGKDKELLEKLIVEMQLQSKIFLKGNAPNYQEAIRQSHIVLQITHIDAMPITLMDSMAMSKAVVVSDVGDMPCWVKEDMNGWISPEVTAEAICKTLEEAWAKRKDWEEMGKQSFRLFKENFPSDPVEYFVKQMGIPG